MARSAALVVLAIMVVASLVSGCAASGPAWVDEGNSYETADIDQVFESAGQSPAEGSPVADAPDLRHDALVALRRQNAEAAAAADLITRTFPSTAGVPTYVERATFDGKTDSLIVVEAIGPEGGNLDDLRVWVLSEGGDVLFAAVR